MVLTHLSLQNFRNYPKAEFDFIQGTTFIVGPNTSGKTNIIEALYLISTGKSFRAEKDTEIILFGKEIARAKGKFDDAELEVVLTQSLKKYLVNNISKRRFDFAGRFPIVLFSPTDLELIIGSPSIRREFLDSVLEQIDFEYRRALLDYTKALRQRNALLELAKETGKRNEKQFEYWDELLIKNGSVITSKREIFIDYLNREKKELFAFTISYDKSIISHSRLEQYRNAEVGAGVTLVGPQRDDFEIRMHANGNNANKSELVDVKLYGSRGQQRLAVLQLKLLQILYMEKSLGFRPTLLLDDIFSELDEGHIQHVLSLTGKQQTIITTTHEEFIASEKKKEANMIKLGLR